MPRRRSSSAAPPPRPRPVRVPQQARSRRTRERVLGAAMACFEAHGFDDTTTAMIAREAGIAVGTLYGYFRDKREILLEILERTIREIGEIVESFLDPAAWQGGDPREAVGKLIDAVFHTQRLQPGLQRILWERYFKDDEFHAPFEAMRERIRGTVEAYAAAVDDLGWLRDVDRESAAYVVVNAVQWNAVHAFMHRSAREREAASAATANMVSRYLFRDAPASRR